MKRLWIGFAAVITRFVPDPGLDWDADFSRNAAHPRQVRYLGRGDADRQLAKSARDKTCGRRLGGMQVGSIWGHGSYVAPDWTADWLHREAVFILNHWAAKPNFPSRMRTGRGTPRATGRSTFEDDAHQYL